jgi:Zn-dependent protease with chaperone function
MMGRQLVLWGVLASLLVSCERWLTTCVGAAPCLAGAGFGSRLMMGLDASAILLVGATVSFATRAVWLLLACAREARRLADVECLPALADLAQALGVRCLRVLAADVPLAFCAEALRPVVHLSVGLWTRLESEQLEAVLLHELDHAARREPLRRAFMQAASEIGFFLPVLGWLRALRFERSELRADRRAIERLGPRAVALALWALDSEPGPAAFPAFAGAASLRVAQLLGDPIPRRRPQAAIIAASLLGALFAVAIVNCAAEVVVFLLR